MRQTLNRTLIRTYAWEQYVQVKKGLKCSCHAMADVYGYAAEQYRGFNNDEESFVEDLGAVMAGVTEWCTPDSTNSGTPRFSDSGFKSEFRDTSNQVRHFTGGVVAGFQYGHWFGGLHRLARPDGPADTALNDISSAIGAGLDGIGTSLEEVKEKIEVNVCERTCGVCNGGRGR